MKPSIKSLVLPVAVVAATAGIAYAQLANPQESFSMPGPRNELVTIDGTVKEIFGNKFIMEDAGGRKLIETGPRGQDTARVAVGDHVKVEGRSREGFTHAGYITLANGKRVALEGPGMGPPGGPDAAFNQATVLKAATDAGYRNPRVQDVKKHHAEVIATDGDGKQWELHVEFNGNIRKTESMAAFSEPEIKALIEKAGYKYAGAMRPEKKHMVVTAENNRGERVEIDVHRDGSIKKEKRVF